MAAQERAKGVRPGCGRIVSGRAVGPEADAADPGSSSSVRIIVSGTPEAVSHASRAVLAASSPASAGDPRGDPFAWLQDRMAPPPLGGLGGDTMLAVAAVPGKILEEWRHAAYGVWIAWPHAADAIHAEEMTAAQLRAILAAREAG